MSHEVIIIGSGLLGAVCANNLAQKGVDVLILEAGAPISTPEGQHLRNQPEYQWHSMILRDIFPDISNESVEDHLLIDMQYFIPTDVQKNNRMILSDGKPEFDVRLSQTDKLMMKESMQDLKNLATHLGRYRKGCEPSTLDFGFTHPMGMCHMGINREESVTDLQGKVHGYNNLFLSTVGLIPTKMAVNPSLTAAALSLATTDHIANN